MRVRRPTLFQSVGVLLTALATVGAVCVVTIAIREQLRLRRLLAPTLVAASVDFSVAGAFEVPVQVRHDLGHGPVLFLEVVDQPSLTAPDLLNELGARVSVLDANGKRVDTTEQELNGFPGAGHRDVVRMYLLTSLRGLGDGPHTLQFSVDKPIAGLSGKPQRLYLQQGFCGLEQLFIYAAGGLGLLLFVVAALCGTLTFQSLRKSHAVEVT